MFDDGKLNLFHSNDYNECIFILYRLEKSKKENRNTDEVLYFNMDYNDLSVNELCNKINELISNKYDYMNIINIKKEWAGREVEFLKHHLSWIKDNDEAAFYLWFFLKLFVRVRDGKYLRFNYSNKESLEYDDQGFKFILKKHPFNNDDIIKGIISCYVIFIENENVFTRLLEDVRNEWKIANKYKTIKWLEPNNDEQCNWAYHYLNERIDYFYDYFKSDPKNNYIHIKTFYNLFYFNAGFKYVYSEMNKAWNQRRYRQSRADKKSLSGYISQDAKMKLTEMAKKTRMPEYELIEFLILEKYDAEKIIITKM